MHAKEKPGTSFVRFHLPTVTFVLLAAGVVSLFAPAASAQSPPIDAGTWDKLVAGAKKEAQVRVISSMGPTVRDALVKGFKDRFGMDAEYVAMRGSEQVQKLSQERRSGLYLWDIYIGGTTTATRSLVPAGLLDPIEPNLYLPEVRDPSAYWSDRLPLYAYGHAMSVVKYPVPNILINTDLVKPDEINDWKDLLNPKWKGKILMDDPTVSGQGHALAVFIYTQNIAGGAEFLKALVNQAPDITRNRRYLTEWVARGKYPISLNGRPAITKPFIDGGAPIKFVIPPGLSPLTHAGGAVGLINKPAHPNAARVFLNWVLTKEAGELWSRADGTQSSRNDVSTEGLPDYLVRQPGGRYFDTNDDEYTEKDMEKANPAIKAIFAPFLQKARYFKTKK